MQLTGEDRGILRNAITNAYPERDELRILLSEKMDKELEESAKGNDYNTEVFNLIKEFQAEGNLDEFVKVAYQEKKGNTKLKAFYQEKFPFSLDSIEGISGQEWESLKNILADIDYNIIEENCRKTLIGINLEAQCPSFIKVKSISTIKEILLNKYPLRKKDKIPTVLEFVQRLTDEEVISSFCDNKQLLKQWLNQAISDRQLSLPIEYTKPPKQYTQGIQEVYLLMEMTENLQIQGQFSLRYQIMLKYQGYQGKDLEKLETIDINADSSIGKRSEGYESSSHRC